MSSLKLATLDHLAAIYLVANTPAYLYDRYRAEQCIQSLARDKSTRELVAIATQIAADTNRTPTELAVGYAALVALTFKDFREATSVLDGVRLEQLEWSDRILELWKVSLVSTGIITVA